MYLRVSDGTIGAGGRRSRTCVGSGHQDRARRSLHDTGSSWSRL